MTNLDLYGGALPRHNGRKSPMPRSVGAGGLVDVRTLDTIRGYQDEASSESTRRGYVTDWAAFSSWCAVHSFTSLPAAPITVAAYLSQAADLVDERGDQFYAPGTLARWLASINKAHTLAGFPKPGAHPDVALTMAGIRRKRARPEAKKAPLLLAELKRALQAIDTTSYPAGIIGQRDWAILLLGFVGAYRRSELAAIDLRDVKLHSEEGLHITLHRSKSNQEGASETKGLPYGANPITCAPCAFVRWLRVLAAVQGPRAELIRLIRTSKADRHVCRDGIPEFSPAELRLPLIRPVMKNGAIKDRRISGNVVNSVVQRRSAAIGLNPAAMGGHSLRAGFVTQSLRAGANHHEVMRQTGHKSATTLEGYSREHDPLAHNSVTRLGL